MTFDSVKFAEHICHFQSATHGPLFLENAIYNMRLRPLIDNRIVELILILPWYKLVRGPLRAILGVNHEKHVWEAGAKVSSVCVMVARGFGGVYVHAFGTVKFDHRLT